MNRELTAVCQMFLIPTSLLFTALAAAETEQLKTLVSIMGFLISLVWAYRMWNWVGVPRADKNTGLWLALVFVAAAGLSTLIHGRLWLHV